MTDEILERAVSLTCKALDGTPPSDQCEKATKQLTALILNSCSGFLSDTCDIIPEAMPGECGNATDVGSLIAWAIGNLNGTDPDGSSCNEVAQCAAAVNEGFGVGAPDESEYPPLGAQESVVDELGEIGNRRLGDRSGSVRPVERGSDRR